MDLVVVGSSNVDTFLTMRSDLPRAGETVFASNKHEFFGGKGANQSVACARLGFNVKFVSCVGRDEDGDKVCARMNFEGLRNAIKRVENEPTGVAVICVAAKGGENTVVVVPGANLCLLEEDLKEEELFEGNPKALLCQNEISLKTTLRALELAKQRKDVVTIWNPAPVPPVDTNWTLVFKNVDILIVNQGEANHICGKADMGLERDPASCAALLIEKVQLAVIITLGSKGACFLDKSMKYVPEFLDPIDAGKVVDTTGAGDCFCGTFALFFSKGANLRHAVGLAQSVAAVAVTKLGCQSSYPVPNECPRNVQDFLSTRVSLSSSA